MASQTTARKTYNATKNRLAKLLRAITLMEKLGIPVPDEMHQRRLDEVAQLTVDRNALGAVL